MIAKSKMRCGHNSRMTASKPNRAQNQEGGYQISGTVGGSHDGQLPDGDDGCSLFKLVYKLKQEKVNRVAQPK